MSTEKDIINLYKSKSKRIHQKSIKNSIMRSNEIAILILIIISWGVIVCIPTIIIGFLLHQSILLILWKCIFANIFTLFILLVFGVIILIPSMGIHPVFIERKLNEDLFCGIFTAIVISYIFQFNELK